MLTQRTPTCAHDRSWAQVMSRGPLLLLHLLVHFHCPSSTFIWFFPSVLPISKPVETRNPLIYLNNRIEPVWLYCPNGIERESSIIEQEQVIKSEPRHMFQAELGLEFSGNIWNRASV